MVSSVKPNPDEVLDQLERVLASVEFAASPRAQGFLRYVVRARLEGRESEISQHAIASEVFQRDGTFDPTTDPIVRMQAGRVRRALEHYYLHEGVGDPVLITLPKGTYVPTVRYREPGCSALVSEPHPPECVTWPIVLLKPLQCLNTSLQCELIGRGLVFDLASELNNYRDLRVLLGSSEDDPRNQEAGAHFEFRGTVSDGGISPKVSVQLLCMDASPPRMVWAQAFSMNGSAMPLGEFVDELAKTIAATIASERGVVAQDVIRHPAARTSVVPGAYAALLEYHHFVQCPSADTFMSAMTALQAAVREHPECGCCWSFLARLLADQYALGISMDPAVIGEALHCGRRGVEMAPADQRARAALGYVYLLNDQVREARHEAEEALAINPRSLFILEGIGYLLTLCGDWERGPALSRKAVRLNPFHLPVVHAGLWLDAVRRQDYEEAYWQSLEFSPQTLFWQPLMEAVSLAWLGRREEASHAVARVLHIKPDFPEHCEWLVRRFVKFDELVERVQEGLRSAGLQPNHARAATAPKFAVG